MGLEISIKSFSDSNDVTTGSRLHTAHTFIDRLLLEADTFCPADELAPRIENCSQHLSAWRTWKPLWNALQTTHTSCPFCSPFGRLSVTYISDSGSTAEGLSDHAAGRRSSSDFDYMYELGNITWLHSAASLQFSDLQNSITTSPPTLATVFRENSRDATIWQIRTSECQHASPLEFHPDTVRQLMYHVQKLRHPSAQVTICGPATAITCPSDMHAGVDHVPSLHLPEWPGEEFVHRKRLNQWPPREARDDICAFGVHLVPIGGHGSPHELHDWRASYSRADIIAAWHLTPVQRAAAKAVKRCKNVLRGTDDCALKSYFIKTALFWLCQDAPSSHWDSVTKAVQMILSFLERAVERGRLECFFWADVNLFEYRKVQLPEMMRMILRVRMNMNEIMMNDCRQITNSKGSTLMPLVACPSAADSEGIKRPTGTRWVYGSAVKNGEVFISPQQELEMVLEFDLEMLLVTQLGIHKTCSDRCAREWRRAIIEEQRCDDGQKGWLTDRWTDRWGLKKFASGVHLF